MMELMLEPSAFIDPFFSSGIHLAMTSGLSATASICAAIRGDCSEVEAAAWHTKRFSLSYTRFVHK
jgi:flavin-dependent dehydrogenase